MECEVLKDGYYFQIEDDYYSIRMWKVYPSGFGLKIAHNYTVCGYTIFRKGKITDTYNEPACSLNGKCTGWFRQ